MTQTSTAGPTRADLSAGDDAVHEFVMRITGTPYPNPTHDKPISETEKEKFPYVPN